MAFSLKNFNVGFVPLRQRWEGWTQTGRWRALNPYLPFLLFTLLGIVFLGGLGLPSLQRLPEAQKRLKAEQQKLAGLKVKNVKLAELLSRQDVLKADLSVVDMAIPDKESVPELLAQIEKIASESGVSVRSLHFGLRAASPATTKGAVPEKGFGRVYLQSEAEGPYANLQTFLGALEKAVRIVDVESLRFNQEVVRETTRLRATLGLVSFFVEKEKGLTGESPVTLDLGDTKLLKVMDILKTMRLYKVEVVSGGAGRLNPFE